MQITLVRHTSLCVPSGICYGISDLDVSSTFTQEASIIKRNLIDKSFNKVYSSPLQRCTKLASFCGYIAPEIDNRLLELNFGNWEMKAWEEISDPQLEKWYANWIDESPTNGESFRSMINRVDEFLKELKSKNENCLIFTHAGVIRVFFILLNYLPANRIFELEVEYGEIFELNI